ncbi:hypothetical protein NFI95_03635 [Acetobacteraceae bacterium KSS8]|uniref:Outer membrane lipoprotein n=1 Tax=Endosaccharibacter trunci TaxID=2812733 RepID=A0ABT1W3T3_9PROT|nr:hypothetical protein [Acetobacteraceae bacterium KSS8]
MRRALLPVLLLSGCTQGFASNQADLMRSPPPSLPDTATAYWNDRQDGTYGALTVAPGRYRYGNALCRTARITSIDDRGRTTHDRMLLYCAVSDGHFVLEPSLSCRSVGGNALSCRGPAGDVLVLPPA